MISHSMKPLTTLLAATALLVASSLNASAQKQYDTGASDTEIKIGNVVAYSGPASNLSVIGKTTQAYFDKINDEGGINGRKLKLYSYDDAYSPPKAIEQVRKLVEGDEVLLVFGSSGTPSNIAVQKYLNNKKVPQLFVASGASRWNDPQSFPWSMGWQPTFQDEGRAYAMFLLQSKPGAKIAVLFQNDDLGKDYLKGLKDGLGAEAAAMIVAEESYEVSEPVIDTHLVKLKASGASVLVDFAQAKFVAQAIRKAYEIGWNPLHIVPFISSSIGTVIEPAGFDKAQGIVSAAYLKDGSDPQWDDDDGMKRFYAFLAKYAPQRDKKDTAVTNSYAAVQALEHVLRRCGDNLTRENIVRQAASLQDFTSDVMLPGVAARTSPVDFRPLRQLHLMQLTKEKWELFGDLIDSRAK